MLVWKASFTAAAARALTFAFVFLKKSKILEEFGENQTTICISNVTAFQGGISHPLQNSAVGILSYMNCLFLHKQASFGLAD